MNDVLITYDVLNSSDLRGTTPADYLVSLEATLRILDGEVKVYEEPAFPVVELARSLRSWLDDPERSDFEFESMSFEELGSVAIQRSSCWWVISSVFEPTGASSRRGWAVVRTAVESFINRVENDLIALGAEPTEVLRS